MALSRLSTIRTSRPSRPTSWPSSEPPTSPSTSRRCGGERPSRPSARPGPRTRPSSRPTRTTSSRDQTQHRDRPQVAQARGPEDCLDHSAKPHKLPWKATDEERAVVCVLPRATNFALDGLTFVVAHFLPHLTRHSIWRILRAERLGRRRPPSPGRPRRGRGEFKDYGLG